MTAAAPKPRRRRSLTESLLSIALGLEAVLVFFAAITAFGLRVLDPLPAFGGGAVLIVLLVLLAGVQRFAWAVVLGGVLQLVLLATGFILPVLFFVAGVFVAVWVFGLVKGRQVDARNAAAGNTP